MSTSVSEQKTSAPASIKNERVKRSLIVDGEPWDRYHLEALLPLKETYRESTEFGFLLRHYWIPATILTFRQSSLTTFPDGRTERADCEIERKMARCRSNECLWREKIRFLPSSVSGERQGATTSEMLCSYDCYDQTFWSDKPILFAPPTTDQKTEARRQALHRLPMLCPPGPVPIGFSWHAKVGDDYMNYRVEAEERIGETSVLVIRREGRYTTGLSNETTHSGNGQSRMPVAIERKGVTLFAWNRAAVLEDRYEDSTIGADTCLATTGAVNQVVTRLIRSCPDKLAVQVSRKSRNRETSHQSTFKCQGQN